MATHFSILASEIPWTRNLVGCNPWGCKESDKTERLYDNNSKEIQRVGNKALCLVMTSHVYGMDTLESECEVHRHSEVEGGDHSEYMA